MLRTLRFAATWVAVALPLAACSTAGGASNAKGASAPGATPVAAGTAYRATGNEPSWRLDVSATEMSLLTDFGQTRVVAPAPTVAVTGATRTFVARSTQGEITATFVDRVCVDTMSGMPHPQSVTVVAGSQTLTGCGGEPASLLQGAEWTVVSIDGKSLVAGSKATLEFAPDGRLSGQSSCNRFMSQYKLSGEGLSIASPAGTRMMCEAPLMQQEQAFLAALSGTQGFSIAADGALLLRTGDGRTIEARRP
ncbi:MAG: META domain-containing protein [Steroidobacteraceae bacterium]